MEYKIIADSCCDMTPELAARLNALSVPLILRLGAKEFIDNENLDLPGFMAEMKAYPENVSSSAPSPFSYKEAMESARHSFAVTLSSRLSGSYSSAELGKTYAQESGGADTYVFDSKSASAGEVLVALKIRELLSAGASRDEVISETNSFISNMKTYFVLERYDNLMKNGRLNKITGKIINIFNIKLVMGADGEGTIALYAKPRGTKKMLETLVSLIRDSGKNTSDGALVICHCNNLSLAQRLAEDVRRNFDFKEILIVPTGGLSSLYADDQGIIMAF